MSLDDNKSVESLESLGVYLSGERDKRGYTRRDLAIKTKIPLEQLAYIEDGQLNKIRPVFAKGFLRAYANELSLDAEDILQIYRELAEGSKNEKKMRALSSIYHEAPGAGAVIKFLKIFGILVILSIIIVVLYYKVPFVHNLISPALSNNPNQGQIEEENSNVSESDVDTEAVAETNLEKQEGEIVLTAADERNSENTGVNQNELIAEGGILELNFNKNAWLELTVDSEKPKYLNFKAGDKRIWKIEKEAVLIANPLNAFQIKWNGNDLGYLGDHAVGSLKFPLK